MPSAQYGLDKRMLRDFGPTIPVKIGYDSKYRDAEMERPNIPEHLYNALVDTGSGICCIDVKVAATLKLEVVDQQLIGGVHGQQLTNLHIAQIYVPSLDFVMTERFAAVDLEGGILHQAIVGRDFLSHHRMVYDGPNGCFTLSRQDRNMDNIEDKTLLPDKR